MSQLPTEASRLEESRSLETDTLFSILSRERRRYALYCLQRYRNPMTLADLADEVARLEYDEESVAEISGEDIKSIYLNLYHSHIPKMADAGVVEYDQTDDMVRLNYEFTAFDLEEYV
jgi:hypothetical protein